MQDFKQGCICVNIFQYLHIHYGFGVYLSFHKTLRERNQLGIEKRNNNRCVLLYLFYNLPFRWCWWIFLNLHSFLTRNIFNHIITLLNLIITLLNLIITLLRNFNLFFTNGCFNIHILLKEGS